MKNYKNNNLGFSMVEVVIASVIFTLSTAGIFATISTLNLPGIDNEREVNAALIARTILEELRTEVDSRVWDDVDLSLLHPLGGPTANGVYPQTPIVINGVAYTPTYTVTNDVDGSNGRIVIVQVTWV